MKIQIAAINAAATAMAQIETGADGSTVANEIDYIHARAALEAAAPILLAQAIRDTASEQTTIAILVARLGGEVLITRQDFADADKLELYQANDFINGGIRIGTRTEEAHRDWMESANAASREAVTQAIRHVRA